MKILHISDLHLGKRINEYSMLEDQKYILLEILNIMDENDIKYLIIAGDIYDKSVPANEVILLLDEFLTILAEHKIKVFAISGNHDAAEKVAYASRLLSGRGIYVSKVYDGKVEPIIIKENRRETAVYLLPFLKPAYVRHIFPDEEIKTYNDALKVAVGALDVDKSRKNILVAHQFVTGATRSDSEDISVGGMDNIDAGIFDDFNYVALGHIHSPQSVGRETIRYSGTPLKYSFSEVKNIKSVTVVDVDDDITIDTIPLIPRRDMLEIKGTYDKLTLKAYYKDLDKEAYYHVTLTDEEDIPNALGKLRTIYPNIMRLDYDNMRTRRHNEVSADSSIEKKDPLKLIKEFYETQNNSSMNDEQVDFSMQILESLKEGVNETN